MPNVTAARCASPVRPAPSRQRTCKASRSSARCPRGKRRALVGEQRQRAGKFVPRVSGLRPLKQLELGVHRFDAGRRPEQSGGSDPHGRARDRRFVGGGRRGSGRGEHEARNGPASGQPASRRARARAPPVRRRGCAATQSRPRRRPPRSPPPRTQSACAQARGTVPTTATTNASAGESPGHAAGFTPPAPTIARARASARACTPGGARRTILAGGPGTPAPGPTRRGAMVPRHFGTAFRFNRRSADASSRRPL